MTWYSNQQGRLHFLGLCLASGILSSNNQDSVEAFTSSSNRVTSARIPTGVRSDGKFQRITTTTSQSVAVEEDLDAALDSLLGDAFKEAGEESHMEDSHPIPKNLLEEVSFFSNLRRVCRFLLIDIKALTKSN